MKVQRLRPLTLLIASSLVADVRSAPPTAPGAASTCLETAFPTVTAAPENDGLASPYLAVSCTDRQLAVESNDGLSVPFRVLPRRRRSEHGAAPEAAAAASRMPPISVAAGSVR